MIETYLWTQADEQVDDLASAGQPVLVVWDESVIEKPESLHLEGLCAVRSGKAKRLKRIKPGYFNPPGGRPICVPGYHWLQVLVMGMEGPIHMAHTRWWSTRGEQATERREVERQTLAEVARRWGSRALHVWDRGFAGNPWLTLAYVYAVRFVMRWPKHYRLVSAEGLERKAWEMTRGKRSWEHRLIGKPFSRNRIIGLQCASAIWTVFPIVLSGFSAACTGSGGGNRGNLRGNCWRRLPSKESDHSVNCQSDNCQWDD